MKTAKLGSIIDQIRGVSYSKNEVADTPNLDHTAVLRANNIKDNKLNFDNVVYVKNERIKNHQIIRQHDIIVAASSGSISVVGKSAQAPTDMCASFGAFCKLIRVKSGVNKKYVGYFFRSNYYKKTIEHLVNGANINNIKNDHINNLMIPLPPLPVQRRIVAVLDQAQALIDKRKEQIALLDELVQSIFYDMFGDPVTNPMGWDEKGLGSTCDIVTGNTPSRKDCDNYGNYIEWIKSDNINNPSTYLTPADEYLSQKGLEKGRYVDSGAILMTCIAGSLSCIGNVAISDRRVSFNQQINALVPKDYLTMFLFWMLHLSKARIQHNSSNSMKGMISKGKLMKLTFMAPPINVQKEFVKFANIMESRKNEMSESIKHMKSNYNNIMQRSF